MTGNLNYRPEPTGRDSVHELSFEERELICNTDTMRALLKMLYRPRGLSRMDRDGRDSYEGWHMEFDSWLTGLEELGKRLRLEAYGPQQLQQVLMTAPPMSAECQKKETQSLTAMAAGEN